MQLVNIIPELADVFYDEEISIDLDDCGNQIARNIDVISRFNTDEALMRLLEQFKDSDEYTAEQAAELIRDALTAMFIISVRWERDRRANETIATAAEASL